MVKTGMPVKQIDNLIYDVGLHRGEDTEYYLKKEFSVIAFEADPDLIAFNANQFKEAIALEKLHIVEGAIIEDPISDQVHFFKNSDATHWGTVRQDWALRNEKFGTKSRKINVPAVDFKECITRYGMPYFMKIDIEGADTVCLRSLLEFDAAPKFISIEASKSSLDEFVMEIELLEQLGYDQFMIVQQANIDKIEVLENSVEGRPITYKFKKGASGLFGKDLRGIWKSSAEIIDDYRSVIRNYRRFGDNSFWRHNRISKFLIDALELVSGIPLPGWYDTHAKHSSVDM